jgi:hypothetical protein
VYTKATYVDPWYPPPAFGFGQSLPEDPADLHVPVARKSPRRLKASLRDLSRVRMGWKYCLLALASPLADSWWSAFRVGFSDVGVVGARKRELPILQSLWYHGSSRQCHCHCQGRCQGQGRCQCQRLRTDDIVGHRRGTGEWLASWNSS